MLYNFDIGSGGKSPQNVNNFNDAYNSDTFLAGCELKGGGGKLFYIPGNL